MQILARISGHADISIVQATTAILTGNVLIKTCL